ncbi:MAG: dockerin type I repeat-containing protein, partial [Erysipelotrichaceae bacterium]|nr:dockerin type I repeat-containing protein [Erysipelotrichaceae bacterium]
AFKPGLSVPLTSVASYQLMLVNEQGVITPVPLTAGSERIDITQTYGGTRFDYKGASFAQTFNIDQLNAGKYRIDLYASINVLKDPVFFTESVVIDSALPTISNFGGRSYELINDTNGILTLVVDDVELIVLKGDVNGDGKISITDLVMLHLTISGIDTFVEFVNRNADMNSDGKISITDLVMLHLLISGIEY